MFTFFVILACVSALAAAFYIGANYGYDNGYNDGWEHGEKCSDASDIHARVLLNDEARFLRNKLANCECAPWPKMTPEKKKAGRPRLSNKK